MFGKNFLTFTLITLVLCFVDITDLCAQKIKAKVMITLENLPLEKQEKLVNFQQIIENYINNYDWANNELDVDIPTTLQIFFKSDISTSYEDRYNIQILISDNTDVQYFDKRCRIEYQQGEIPEHRDNSWNSLTGLLDFYINLLLGDEMDKFDRYKGTPYFEKAKIIAEQAKFGMGRFIEGWDLRIKLIQDILSEDNKKFREMKDFYYYGIFFTEEDINKARKYCSAAVDMIEEIMKQDPESEKCKKFLSAHYIELIDLFKESDNKNIFERLMQLDTDHAEIYKEYL